jgi:hypothetical protein
MDSVKLVGIAYTGDSQGLVYGNRFDSVDIGSKVEFDLGEEVEMADAIYLSGLKQPGAVAVQQNTIIQADRNGILVDDSHINALRYASTNDSGAQGSAFAGNSILPDAIGNGDEFAFQENCKGFDDKSVAELLSKGSSYVDPHDKSTLEQTPSTGKATLGTNWPTASDLSAAQ